MWRDGKPFEKAENVSFFPFRAVNQRRISRDDVFNGTKLQLQTEKVKKSIEASLKVLYLAFL